MAISSNGDSSGRTEHSSPCIVHMKKPPTIDETDVDRMINFMFGRSINTNITSEERADAAYQVALAIAKMQNHSVDYAEALAERVRSKALWIKVAAGSIEEMPE